MGESNPPKGTELVAQLASLVLAVYLMWHLIPEWKRTQITTLVRARTSRVLNSCAKLAGGAGILQERAGLHRENLTDIEPGLTSAYRPAWVLGQLRDRIRALR